MCIQLGPEFNSLEEEVLKTDVYKKGPEIQCLEG